jgi:hypothetical protein
VRALVVLVLDWVCNFGRGHYALRAIGQLEVELVIKFGHCLTDNFGEDLADEFSGEMRQQVVHRDSVDARGLPRDKHIHLLEPRLHKLLKGVATLPQVHIYHLRQEILRLDDNRSVDVAQQLREEHVAALDLLH